MEMAEFEQQTSEAKVCFRPVHYVAPPLPCFLIISQKSVTGIFKANEVSPKLTLLCLRPAISHR